MPEDREDLAFEALIAGSVHSSLRGECQEADVREGNLPPLTEEESRACLAMSSDIMLLLKSRSEAKGNMACLDSKIPQEVESEAMALYRGAENLTPEAKAEIERRRKEVIDKLKKDEEEDGQAEHSNPGR